MVIESIIHPVKAAKKPWKLVFVGAIYATLGIFLSLWIFEEYASLVMVFLTVACCIPLFYYTILAEEKKDIEMNVSEMELLKEHSKALFFFIFLFAGMTIAYALWYLFLPSSISSGLFSVQSQTIASINQQVTGNVSASLAIFTKIFLNNVKVMVFCILFSFIYGSGAIFILTWNASVLGTAMGNFMRVNLSQYASEVGLAKVGAYFYVFSLSLVRYFVHGIPEIFAYFVAGLAGGIISFAIVRHDFGTKKFERVLLDFSDLIFIALLILFVAGIVEVYVTPLFF